jgi:hypothetical protein
MLMYVFSEIDDHFTCGAFVLLERHRQYQLKTPVAIVPAAVEKSQIYYSIGKSRLDVLIVLQCFRGW